MRSHGHAAAVLDEGVGFVYGPVLTNGYRVWVSDEPLPAGEEDPADAAMTAGQAEEGKPASGHPLADALRLIVGALLMTGLLVIGIWLAALAVGMLSRIISLLFDDPRDWPERLVGLWQVMMPLGCIALVLCVGPLMVRMTRSFRDPGSPLGWTLRGIVILTAVGEVLTGLFLLLLELLGVSRFGY